MSLLPASYQRIIQNQWRLTGLICSRSSSSGLSLSVMYKSEMRSAIVGGSTQTNGQLCEMHSETPAAYWQPM